MAPGARPRPLGSRIGAGDAWLGQWGSFAVPSSPAYAYPAPRVLRHHWGGMGGACAAAHTHFFMSFWAAFSYPLGFHLGIAREARRGLQNYCRSLRGNHRAATAPPSFQENRYSRSMAAFSSSPAFRSLSPINRALSMIAARGCASGLPNALASRSAVQGGSVGLGGSFASTGFTRR